MYCKEAVSNCEPYELRHLDDSGNDLESAEYENMDLENFVFGKVTEEIETRLVKEFLFICMHPVDFLDWLKVQALDSSMYEYLYYSLCMYA